LAQDLWTRRLFRKPLTCESAPLQCFLAMHPGAQQQYEVPTEALDASAMSAEEQVDTWLFVDLDGVVNVGIRDDEGGMLDFNPTNLRRAKKGPGFFCCPGNPSARRLLSVANCELDHGEDATYTKLLSSSQLYASETLVERLAQLISAAGNRRKIVLTSRWRLPQYAERVLQIEDAISTYLGKPFSFDDRTPPCQDTQVDQRLSLIGSYIAEHCNPSEQGQHVRVLVLEDFHATPLSGWKCDGVSMSSAYAVEQYLRGRFKDPSAASVRLLHTYDEWKTKEGLLVQIGAGLTMKHFCKGLHFLGQQCEYCTWKHGNSRLQCSEFPIEPVTTAGFDTIFCWLPTVHVSKAFGAGYA